MASLTRCELFPQAEDWLRQFLLPVSSKELVKVSHLLNYIDTCELNKPGTYTHICTHGHTPVNLMVTQRVKAGPVFGGQKDEVSCPIGICLQPSVRTEAERRKLSAGLSPAVSLAQVVVLQEDQTR